jgi:4,5-DOPA dioxygenase extradiol
MKRSDFLKTLSMLPLVSPVSPIGDLLKLTRSLAYAPAKLPVLFIGHGDPENAFRDNPFTRQLSGMTASLPFKPSAVLVISGHYLTEEKSFLKVQPFFDSPYYKVNGAMPFEAHFSKTYNIQSDGLSQLDHGAWAVLNHLFPNKDVPVMELSMPMYQSLNYHWNLAQQLKELRYKGVLIVGSGNVVHNLQLSAMGSLLHPHKPYSWALEMDAWIKENIDNRNWMNLMNYQVKGKAAKLAINTADHYIPMLYVLAMTAPKEQIVHTYEEVLTAVSMRCFMTQG